MRPALTIANLGFLPRSADLGLLFLRLSLGLSMLCLHGWDKLIHFPAKVEAFPDPFGMGRHLTLVLAVVIELAASLLVIFGLLTRFASLLLAITMTVAFFGVHRGGMTSPGAELAALYAFGFVTLVIAGGGYFAADSAKGPYTLAGLGAFAGLIFGYPLSYAVQPADFKAAVSFPQYLSGVQTHLSASATQFSAFAVWTASVVLMAIAGFVVGRAMNRRRERLPERVPAAS